MDEDGKLYFTADSTRLFNGKPFLAGRGGLIGSDKRETPFTGTFVKAGEKDVRFLTNKSPIPLGDDKPNRPPDLAGPGVEEVRWAEGVEWLYAGSSPIVPFQCKCPTQRSHTDWYKRSYVPEMYRHSYGILDTNGNLIMHLGRYGNFDECPSLTGRLEDVTMVAGRFIGGTDDYVAFPDRGERITVLKLNYHVEESVRIRSR
jgi:hypothetical protein